MAEFRLLGSHFKNASLSDLESIFLRPDEIQTILTKIPSNVFLDGFVVLNTCNRVEWYIASDRPEKVREWIVSILSCVKGISLQSISKLMPLYSEKESIRHLFSVASGLESLVLGESEILSQIKAAYQQSQENRTACKLIHKYFQSAIAAGKRVRAESGISQGSLSISSIAIEAIREKVLDYYSRKFLVVGAGDMAKKAIKKLCALGIPDITITNRTDSKAVALAEAYQISARSFQEFPLAYPNYDILIFATSASSPLLIENHVNWPTGSKCIVDIGMPRNVCLAEAITVEKLKETAEKSIVKRRGQITIVQDLLNLELNRLYQWIDCQAVTSS